MRYLPLVSLLLSAACTSRAIEPECAVTVPTYSLGFFGDSTVQVLATLDATCATPIEVTVGRVVPAEIPEGRSVVRWTFHNASGPMGMRTVGGSSDFLLVQGPLNGP